MKNKYIFTRFGVVAIYLLNVALFAQVEIREPSKPATTVKIMNTSTAPQAIVVRVNGTCEWSEDGTHFQAAKAGEVFTEGVTLRTAANSRLDMFFRRIGTSVRLQEGTEVKLEKLERHMKEGTPQMETLLDLRAGRIFTVVRSLVPGCTFEIRNAAGRSVVEGGGAEGRYIVTADGTHVTEKKSTAPLKVIRETGVTVIAPGMRYDAKDGKTFSVSTPEAVKSLIDFDELHSLIEQESAKN
ncbi:MAG: hypothetical protein JWO95_626 [Verrucomicrobiales bacterium]|nr:hypothetical protein [Verrucomicrobiales bacterium]